MLCTSSGRTALDIQHEHTWYRPETIGPGAQTELTLWAFGASYGSSSDDIFDYYAAATIQNASCALLSIWTPTEPQRTLDHYRLFLLTEEKLSQGLSSDGSLADDTDYTAPGITALSLASCSAQECNGLDRCGHELGFVACLRGFVG